MDYKAVTRKTLVEDTVIFEPGHFINKAYPEHELRWTVMTRTKTGMLPSKTTFMLFETEEEAQKFVDDHPDGAELVTWDSHVKVSDESRAWIANLLDGDRSGDFFNIGGDDGYLAWNVLSEAGINNGFKVNEDIVDLLGEERIDRIKSDYEENWEVVAELEFLWLTVPHSSPAFLAAAYNFHTYITLNDFSAGYILRDLECLVYGVEAEAQKAIEMRKNAGAKGREASAKARNQRIVSLLEGMEDAARRNPDIVVDLGPNSLAAVGMSAATKNNPQLWSQGSGRVDDYLGEIRRGEAGEKLQQRYFALFPPKTA